jgi:hypothetical protein
MSRTVSVTEPSYRARSLATSRVLAAKPAYTTSRIPLDLAAGLLAGPDTVPEVGDVVLARVSAIGQHKRLELPDGRRAALFVGDEIVVCFGHRYAPDQYEAEVPEDLGPCELVAAGGVAARTLSRHSEIGAATQLEPVGLLCDAVGRRLNLGDWALPALDAPAPRVPVIAVVGTSMNAGKTTTVAGVVRGLANAGLRVGTAKVTGTGAGGDPWLMVDAGADPVLDFTAAGLPSTYLASPAEVEDCAELLVGHVARAGVDAVVLEVADGVYQRETADLVSSPRFSRLVDAVLFAAGDAGGAVAGVSWLRERDLPVVGLSGLLTASPLAMREAAGVCGVPVYDLEALGAAEIGAALGAKGTARAAT